MSTNARSLWSLTVIASWEGESGQRRYTGAYGSNARTVDGDAARRAGLTRRELFLD
jgi:hypothetical protein